MKITEVLKAKPTGAVVTVSPDATVKDLLGVLASHNIGAVIVSSDGSAVDGIVSERDVVRRLNDTEGLLESPVASIMTSTVHTCDHSEDLDTLMGMMTERRIRHVPVLADDALVGVISIGDVVKHKIGQLEFERDQLDSYVHQT
ncbi:MAG: CBS domain-containing protein [Marmoricola sp.]|jgi:CBS domain-containing protein